MKFFKVKVNLQQDRATPKFLNFKFDEQLQSFLFEEKQQSLN